MWFILRISFHKSRPMRREDQWLVAFSLVKNSAKKVIPTSALYSSSKNTDSGIMERDFVRLQTCVVAMISVTMLIRQGCIYKSHECNTKTKIKKTQNLDEQHFLHYLKSPWILHFVCNFSALKSSHHLLHLLYHNWLSFNSVFQQ